ncbi:MAG TPA: DUF262 domain-containing protein [Nitrospira sp.]|uniref:DUF262 domain-containing protein n=1 Tax=Accumulibacter sp. TaxID=2053492 RepID=UPI002C6547C9|nr:DUF262 domain-containing protein [Accumulibacter sp.]HMU31908.1 DUF262 domain-containing protein [Nitrospira sp.]HMY99568.1 DUF262 domain-containing protein [Burkholderiaceae bacterium]HMW57474.1 DUF262 domain-containing protein [Accumulibacter sp.]HMX93308.1 DUF262 domain-containing protein [Nitrospira sp.]HNB43518.1 DUF262 domain-containing protein [Burkholderiaceae bacterium]
MVDLVNATLEGRIRIPEFQRPIRWQWEDVRRLFESIAKGYPIGNLLLWKRPAPAATVILGGLKLDAKAFDEGLWVVDGQQRLTSLANALTSQEVPDDRFSISYDLRNQTFVRSSRDSDGHVVPLPVLYDLQMLIRWFTKDHPEASEGLDQAARITRLIREYSVPAYLVDQSDEAVLRDIFDRMNNYGKRLSRAEVFSALHPGEPGIGDSTINFQSIAESIHSKKSFGVIDDDTIMRAVLARRGGNVTRDIRIEFGQGVRESRDFAGESPETAYREGEGSIIRAISFLQEDAGIPNFSLLPYRYLLVVLARFFAHFPSPSARNRQLLRRWFWRAAMLGPGPFASSWTNAMRTLATRIVSEDETGSVQRLLSSPLDSQLHLPRLEGFKTSSAESRIVLAAMWALQPRSIKTGVVYSREDLAEAIQPPEVTLKDVARRIFSREPEDQSAWAANRIFVLEQELSESLTAGIADQSARTECSADEFLQSHALSEEMVVKIANGEKEEFLRVRQAHIRVVVERFLQRMSETELEDTPPLDDFDLDDVELDHEFDSQ